MYMFVNHSKYVNPTVPLSMLEWLQLLDWAGGTSDDVSTVNNSIEIVGITEQEIRVRGVHWK